MLYLFWGLTVTMLIAAICFAALPLRSGKSYISRAGVIVALVFPLASFGLYALLGSPDAITAEAPAAQHAQQKATVTANNQADRSLGTVASLLDGLKTKLEENPDDAGNWMLLARSYQHLGHYAEALAAYERAQSLGTTDTEFEAWLAGAVAGWQQ